jgi:hypothetical protein
MNVDKWLKSIQWYDDEAPLLLPALVHPALTGGWSVRRCGA